MLTIGAHLSTTKGYLAMGTHATELGANTFAFFTRNPRGGAARAIDQADVDAFLAYAKAHAFGRLVGHASYTMNGASKSPALRDYARDTIIDDLRRMAYTPGNYYNFHPGSHVGQGVDEGIRHIVAMLDAALSGAGETTVLLETMSGKGTEIGGRFEELAAIRAQVQDNSRLGVCLDTCHVWDAGYDIAGDLDGVLTAFDKVIGLRHLHAVHLNDSMNPRGSHKDRHAGIGEGAIGLEAFGRIVNHPVLRGLSFILETPSGDEGWKREIAVLRGLDRG